MERSKVTNTSSPSSVFGSDKLELQIENEKASAPGKLLQITLETVLAEGYSGKVVLASVRDHPSQYNPPIGSSTFIARKEGNDDVETKIFPRRVAVKVLKTPMLQSSKGKEANVSHQAQSWVKSQEDNLELNNLGKAESKNPKFNFHKMVNNEIFILKSCCKNSPFIVNFEFEHFSDSIVYIGMEYCAGGDLLSLCAAEAALQPNEILFYAVEILAGLRHLHDNLVLHCDLKPENIALSPSGHVRLIDFGMSLVFDKEKDFNHDKGRFEVITINGTLHYSDNLILQGLPHGLESDYFAFAVILFELLFHQLPWCGETVQETCMLICTKPIESVPGMEIQDPLCLDLIKQLTWKDPLKRLGYHKGFVEVIKHPWFQTVCWEAVDQQAYKPPFELK